MHLAPEDHMVGLMGTLRTRYMRAARQWAPGLAAGATVILSFEVLSVSGPQSVLFGGAAAFVVSAALRGRSEEQQHFFSSPFKR